MHRLSLLFQISLSLSLSLCPSFFLSPVNPVLSATKGTVIGVEGSSVTISCTLTKAGFPAVTSALVTWSVVSNSSWNVNLPHITLSADRLSLTISNIQKGYDVIYKCSVTNTANLASSSNIALIFQGKHLYPLVPHRTRTKTHTHTHTHTHPRTHACTHRRAHTHTHAQTRFCCK